jgi:hypothetical protein
MVGSLRFRQRGGNPRPSLLPEALSGKNLKFGLLIKQCIRGPHLNAISSVPGTVPKKQCCGSGMFIPSPDFYPSRIPDLIPDPKTTTKKGGGKKFVVISFIVATHFTKLKIILFL